ncbi:IS6 family transposase [Undibacterium seohonense]|uniref:IS6 family transposase n=1 Tax=Undibacterium seohonense TaxID=1344950 RepID=A0ABR6XBQ9_9BURK|nr:IS6 family transposase [Undibacterium seohonense]MBC3809714.1 IS6 family transposase [Undibacterium seohonense]
MQTTKRLRFPIEVILVCIRWYAAYPLSYLHIEEMMEERGVCVDHSSINRWSIRFLPMLEKVFRQHKRRVGASWRMDETDIKVKGVWKYLYRAVDKEGKTIDFLLTAKRDKAAAMRFFDRAMQDNGIPEKVTMDKSGANKSAIDELNDAMDGPMLIHQVKYLNNIVEQDHRAVKRITKPMLGFKSFHAAKSILAGIELMYMIRKGQLMFGGTEEMSFADQFYALAGQIHSV